MQSVDHTAQERELSEAMPYLTPFIVASKIIHLAQLSSDGTVYFVNYALATSLKMPPEVMAGMNFSIFLTEADRKTFERLIATQAIFSTNELLLNLVDIEQIPHTIRCRFAPAGDGLLLLGEPLLEDSQALQEELLQINNQLTVLSRENIRKKRELARTLKKLEETYEQLDKSFWHLKKIQEVLPICMECGKVKSTDASWESVVSFLKKNSLFLSHGYCPECAEIVHNQYKNEQKEGLL